MRKGHLCSENLQLGRKILRLSLMKWFNKMEEQRRLATQDKYMVCKINKKKTCDITRVE
jgi:hypothetical protein